MLALLSLPIIMPLPSGMMWRHTPCFQFVARLLDRSTFWVTIVLCVDMLLVLSLGRTFGATGVRSVFNPACRTDNARLDHTPLDLVILWEVRCVEQLCLGPERCF